MCKVNETQMQKDSQVQKDLSAGQPVQETQEEARLLEQRQRLAERRNNLWTAGRQIAVQMPQMTFSKKGDVIIEGEQYARKSKESIGATKRRMYQTISYSALYKREERAKQVEAAQRQWQDRRERIREEHPEILQGRTAEEADIIAQFWSDNEAQNQELLGPNMREECLAQFMELDLTLDLRTDQAFADHCPKLEEIFRKSEAFISLFESNSDFVSNLPGERTEAVIEKMQKVKALSNYYQIRKKIMTNAYYRSHYHSEISYRYHESDTKEQKNLTLLLWQMESVKKNEWFPDGNALMIPENQLNEFRRIANVPKEERDETIAAKNAMGLNSAYGIGVNAQEMEREGRILSHGSQPVHDGVERLSGREADNLELMRSMKEEFGKRMNYLERKYGNGLPLLSPQELVGHRAEIVRDFADLQQYGRLIELLKEKGREFFDPEREEDKKLERLQGYYSRWLHTERQARTDFAKNGTNYSDYKKKAAVDAVYKQMSHTWLPLARRVEDMIAASDTMRLDVDWEAFYDEQDVRFEEILMAFDQERLLEKGRQLQDELSRTYDWVILFPESRNMTSNNAARHFVEKEARGHVEEMRQSWRNEGFAMRTFASATVGSEDFREINRHYREILGQEDLQRQHGLTKPEDVEEYQSFLRRTEDMAEEICKVEYYSEKAGQFRDEIRNRMRQGNGRAGGKQQGPDVRGVSYRTLDASLERLENQYAERISSIRNMRLLPLYKEFLDFQERAGMWTTPENKTLAEEVLEPVVQEFRPEVTVTLAGERFELCDSPLSEMLEKQTARDIAAPEGLRREIERYNDIYIRHQVYLKAKDESMQVGEQAAGSLWQRLRDAGMQQEKYMAYDLEARCEIYENRMKQSLSKIEAMLQNRN